MHLLSRLRSCISALDVSSIYWLVKVKESLFVMTAFTLHDQVNQFTHKLCRLKHAPPGAIVSWT